ncbi:glycine zipper 2TM domain-containing protein [Calidifontimicrobium sp. SYSU G02091]|uniref:glycine zipper 2TM domain-containing protein n=1 Tax=Calidifontimicrobium sp. SYSU G02091 TaxID=2926421 RepID=UPI001F53C7C9|nr:glycine zipper 2TM domain-containing protein [Calidifontimicrobium sp. SYSU G02091]MCI1192223.1 glycine zipper 2TM domain-containing protein [Calidifontimicrobium sp. SYSU G02091]
MTSTLFPPQPVRSVAAASLLLAALALSGCASLSARDRNTAVGAAVGGVAGSVLTDGSAIGTLGGAVIGGVIGREADTGERKDERDRRKRDRRD